MPAPVFYPRTFVAALGGTICGDLSDIVWEANYSEAGITMDYLDTSYLKYFPESLIGPTVTVHCATDPSIVVILALTPKRGGVPIGDTLTLVLS